MDHIACTSMESTSFDDGITWRRVECSKMRLRKQQIFLKLLKAKDLTKRVK
ncbi:hypothetical protein F2Q69_00038142 [Brassica cretica]|uniref:Uncharacterized protein n=1 Tax=Brassica cretica TaxID=69181 RepID=A0A8S9SGV0_BRACR|nr:hypothetical protein F2Q69_00038142 [Brassica cretica]